MDGDSTTFGSPGAGGTPGSNDILAQPPLPEENASTSGTPSGNAGESATGDGQTVDGMRIHNSIMKENYYRDVTKANIINSRYCND